MSFRGIRDNNTPARTLRASRVPIVPPYVRNPVWPALTAPTSSEQKAVGLYAVFPGDNVGNGGNFFAVNCAGAYTVSYGDGTSVNTATDVQTNYEYNFANANLYKATVTFTDVGDLVNRTAHGYSNGDIVRFYRIVTTTGLTEAQSYFVISATANTFQVSTTVGGSAVALTTNGSAELLSYRIATVTITPQAGQNLTTVNLQVKHPTSGSSPWAQVYSTGWLDIAIAGSNITTLTISASVPVVNHVYLTEANIVNPSSVISFAALFYNCGQLSKINIDNTAAVTNTSEMFRNCYVLRAVPLFNTALVQNMTSMFDTCVSLREVPLFNTVAATNMGNMFFATNLESVPLFNTSAVTNMSGMFQNMSFLSSVPLFNTALVQNMSSMFNGCRSLGEIPPFNTVAATNMLNMFNSCILIKSVPLFNTAAVTNMSSMFSGCPRLESVPLFNTALVQNMSSMFNQCVGLRSVPLFNTVAVTNMLSMFNGCHVLESVPLFNTAIVTNMNSMFNACFSLRSIPLLNTVAVTSMNSMFNFCLSLQTIPLLNTAAVTTRSTMFSSCLGLSVVPAISNNGAVSSAGYSSMFNNCPSLARIQATNIKFSFSVTGCKLSATALNEIYTNLPAVTGQTITVTNNYGTAGDTPSIATAKGWTVTG